MKLELRVKNEQTEEKLSEHYIYAAEANQPWMMSTFLIFVIIS